MNEESIGKDFVETKNLFLILLVFRYFYYLCSDFKKTVQWSREYSFCKCFCQQCADFVLLTAARIHKYWKIRNFVWPKY